MYLSVAALTIQKEETNSVCLEATCFKKETVVRGGGEVGDYIKQILKSLIKYLPVCECVYG